MVDKIVIAKGSLVTVSIRVMNRSEVFWGPNAKEFEPERWLTLNDDPLRAKEIQGHRHLVTFLDGPRTCLGKSFALAEFKVCCVRSGVRTDIDLIAGGIVGSDQELHV